MKISRDRIWHLMNLVAIDNQVLKNIRFLVSRKRKIGKRLAKVSKDFQILCKV